MLQCARFHTTRIHDCTKLITYIGMSHTHLVVEGEGVVLQGDPRVEGVVHQGVHQEEEEEAEGVAGEHQEDQRRHWAAMEEREEEEGGQVGKGGLLLPELPPLTSDPQLEVRRRRIIRSSIIIHVQCTFHCSGLFSLLIAIDLIFQR